MDIKEILSLEIEFLDKLNIIKELNKEQENPETENYIDNYKGNHTILSITDEVKNGKLITKNKNVFNFQKLIVKLAASFLLGSPITLVLNNLTDDNSRKFELFKEFWANSNSDSILYQFCKKILVQTRAGIQTLKAGELGVFHNIVDYENSIYFYANFNEYNKIDSFLRSFKTKVLDIEDNKIYEKNYTDLITETERIIYNVTDNQLVKTETIENFLPCIYAQIEESEFAIVQKLIDRYEKIFNRNGDSNDYFTEPKMYIEGRVMNIENLKKGQAGDIIEIASPGTGNAKLGYLTWDRASESYKNEIETLKRNIFLLTQTPEIDFENLKGIGNVSGVALELMFLATTIKTKEHIQLTFNKVVKSFIEIMKNQLTSNQAINEKFNDLDIGFYFNDGLPINEKELIETLATSVNSGILSKETAIENNPYSVNAMKEVQRIDSESMNDLAESFE